MDQDDLLRRVTEVLERLDLPYLVTGSMATILYGEPRFTNDIDVVVQLSEKQVDAFVEAFPAAEFYVDREKVLSAIAIRSQFNVIHPRSGLKVDVMIPAMDAFDRSRFSRARRVRAATDLEASFAAPEDVIVKKLEYYAAGGSDRHLRDVAGILRVSPGEVDRVYVAEWAERFGLSEIWERVVGSAEGSEPV